MPWGNGGFTYILASKQNGTLYVGVTAYLSNRVQSHKEGRASKFTTKYGVRRLVWFEHYDRIEDAIASEKQIKNWRRSWKLKLIEQQNPKWADLSRDLHSVAGI